MAPTNGRPRRGRPWPGAGLLRRARRVNGAAETLAQVTRPGCRYFLACAISFRPRRSAVSMTPRQDGGGHGIRRTRRRCRADPPGEGGFFPESGLLDIIHRPSSPRRFLRQEPPGYGGRSCGRKGVARKRVDAHPFQSRERMARNCDTYHIFNCARRGLEFVSAPKFDPQKRGLKKLDV